MLMLFKTEGSPKPKPKWGQQPDTALEPSRFIAYFQVTSSTLSTKKKREMPHDQKWPMSVHKSLSSPIKTKVSVVILL